MKTLLKANGEATPALFRSLFVMESALHDHQAFPFDSVYETMLLGDAP